MDYDKFWLFLGVPAINPIFYDLDLVVSVLNCYSQGFDISKPNPCYPNSDYFLYPKIWFLFSYLPIDSNSTVAIAIGMITIFYVFIFWLIGRLNINEGIYYGLIMCSPPVMLAVERGQTDLIIFILCALSVLIIKKNYHTFWAYTFVIVASFLKLSPFAAIIAFLNEKKKGSLIVFFILLSIGIIYISLNWRDIIYMSHNFQEKFWSKDVTIQYGCLVFLNLLDYYPVFHNIFSFIPKKIIAYAAIAVLILTLLFVAKKQKSFKLNIDQLFSFKIGACLYIGTFLIGNNYNYKFIFLIFAMPQLFAWVKYNKEIRTAAMLVLTGIIITFWSNVLFDKFYFFVYTLMEESINWYIFAFLIFMMIHTLPLWAKRMLFFENIKE